MLLHNHFVMYRQYFYFTFLSMVLSNCISAQPETYFSNLLAQELNGITEYKVQGGRVDILTDQYAIEVKRASDWKHSIGQALWYGLQTNKAPGIILLMKSQDDRKYGIMLQSALDYGGLNNVKVWFYPEDFGGQISKDKAIDKNYQLQNKLLKSDTIGCAFWINTGSKKKTRHNQNCTWYNNTKKGRCTNTKEGNACGICGG